MNKKHDSNRVVTWCCAVVGGAIIIYGLRGLIGALHGVTSRQFLQWFVGANIVHDVIVAPAACVIGVAIARLVPAFARAQVRAGIFATAVVLAIAWAPLRGYGHETARGNSSVQPLNYATAVPTVLVAVWVLAGGWLVVALLRRRMDPRRQPTGDLVV